MAKTKPGFLPQSDGIAFLKPKQLDGLPQGLTTPDLLNWFGKMVLIRATDERIWTLNRQGKIPIAAPSQGHEAAQLGSFLASQKDGHCFLFPYYRHLALKMGAGLTPIQVMLSFMGKTGDPYSNGRQFPLQGADLSHNIIQISNVVAAGMTQAVGYALACRLLGEATVVLVFFGDGASSEGETHEAMNFASIHRLPVVFICENNRLAISVTQIKQMAIQNVADRAQGYGFPGIVVDGLDFVQAYEATRKGIIHARQEGPILLEMKVERLMPHTTDDDDRRYRSPEDMENLKKQDPLVRFTTFMVEQGLLTEPEIDELRSEARQAVDEATAAAEAASYPDQAGIYDHVYAP